MNRPTNQRAFLFPHRQQASALRPGEIVVDLFAGGGGASEALRQALGRDPDIAINHDAWAIGLHSANHPFTRHLQDDVWHADPAREVAGRKVGWLHASPDCTHFSQAKGGQPRNKAIRSLSWVVLKWAGQLARAGSAPRIISLENVRQILGWGPLVAKRDKATGRVVKLDGTLAAKGERVPVEQQFLVPDKRHTGRTWRRFVALLRGLGYAVEWRELVASDYGAGTSRSRLFLVARRDGEPIRWPAPTHGKAPGLLPLVTAADSIDWSIPCPSIFTRKRPLADATLRRIARGIQRFVLDAAEPFIVPATHQGSDRCNPSSEPLPTITAANRGELMACQPVVAPLITEHANASNQRSFPADEPLRTQCAGVKGGHFAVVAPVLVQAAHGEGRPDGVKRWGTGTRDVADPLGTVTASGGHAVATATLIQTGYGERSGQQPRVPGLGKPLGTLVDGQKHALVTAFLEQANGGYAADNAGHAASEPVSTIAGTGSQQRLVTAHLATLRNNCDANAATAPLRTIAAGGEHHAVVECTLSPEHEAGALQVAAFLMRYHGTGGQWSTLDAPLSTVTTKDRLALVTVTIHGQPYVIVDIGLRMLTPRELFRAQGFPADYIIDRTADGRPLTISRSVKLVGNSVSPPPLRAIATANLDLTTTEERLAA